MLQLVFCDSAARYAPPRSTLAIANKASTRLCVMCLRVFRDQQLFDSQCANLRCGSIDREALHIADTTIHN
jgi:hypothetical protein